MATREWVRRWLSSGQLTLTGRLAAVLGLPIFIAGLSWSISVKDAMTTNLVMALAAAETIIVMRHYQPRQSLRFIYSIALAAVCTWLINWLLNEWMSGEAAYLALINQWVVVRGVSDIADAQKGDDHQIVAAHNAAMVVRALIPHLRK